MKIYGMPEDAKRFKWVVARKYKGKMWYVNAWNDHAYAVTHAVVRGYKVYAQSEIQ